MSDLRKVELDDEDLNNVNGGVAVGTNDDKNIFNGILGFFSRIFGFGNNKNQKGIMDNNKGITNFNIQDSGRNNTKFM